MARSASWPNAARLTASERRRHAASGRRSREAGAIVSAEFGKGVVFVVEWRLCDVGARHRRMEWRYVLGLKGSTGQGFSHYMSFDRACSALLSRARRYDRAYSKPRGLARAAS